MPTVKDKQKDYSMTKEYTRGELIASSIKAHPEMTEAEIAKMIDNHIEATRNAAREVALQLVLIAIRDMGGPLFHVDTLVEVEQRIEALKQRGAE